MVTDAVQDFDSRSLSILTLLSLGVNQGAMFLTLGFPCRSSGVNSELFTQKNVYSTLKLFCWPLYNSKAAEYASTLNFQGLYLQRNVSFLAFRKGYCVQTQWGQRVSLHSFLSSFHLNVIFRPIANVCDATDFWTPELRPQLEETVKIIGQVAWYRDELGHFCMPKHNKKRDVKY